MDILSIVPLIVCFIAIIIGTVTDIRTREVPDWVNYSLIFLGVGFALIMTVYTGRAVFIISSITGLALFFLLGMLMFYTGQWGGGDSKMLMGIGAVIGLNAAEYSNWLMQPPFLLDFVVYSLICGAVYGLLWSIGAAILNRHAFRHEFVAALKKAKTAKKWLLAISVFVIGASFFAETPLRLLILVTVFVSLITYYAFIFIKAVEKSCMLRKVLPSELTEGDWIAEDVVVNKQVITGPKDLGIEKHKIEQLIRLHKTGKVDKILIKVGIPFVPSFLFAFLLSTFYAGGWLAIMTAMVF